MKGKIVTVENIYRVTLLVEMFEDEYEFSVPVHGAPSKNIAKQRAIFEVSFPEGTVTEVVKANRIA